MQSTYNAEMKVLDLPTKPPPPVMQPAHPCLLTLVIHLPGEIQNYGTVFSGVLFQPWSPANLPCYKTAKKL